MDIVKIMIEEFKQVNKKLTSVDLPPEWRDRRANFLTPWNSFRINKVVSELEGGTNINSVQIVTNTHEPHVYINLDNGKFIDFTLADKSTAVLCQEDEDGNKKELEVLYKE